MSRVHKPQPAAGGTQPLDAAVRPPAAPALVEDGALVPYDGSRPLIASAWKLTDYSPPGAARLALATTDRVDADEQHTNGGATTEAGRPKGRGLVLVLLAMTVAAILYWMRPSLGVGGAAGLRLTGVLMANDVVVSSRTAGRIQELRVSEGTSVNRGDVVARLDRDEMLAERTRHEAAISELAAKLAQGQEAVSLQQDRARGDVARADAQLEAVRSQYDEAVVELEQRRSDAARGRQLLEKLLLPLQEYERLETAVRMADARVRSVRDQVTAAVAARELTWANEREVTLANQNVEQFRAALAQARAALARVKTQLGYTNILAPLTGRVSLRAARQGEVVNAGDPIVTIVNLDDIWASAHIEEGDLWRLQLGQQLPVETASGERVTGTITFLSPEAEFATQRDVSRVKRDIRTFAIRAALPNPGYRLHPGMTVYITLPQPATEAAAGL
jgi:multidrug resistance efflux pump